MDASAGVRTWSGMIHGEKRRRAKTWPRVCARDEERREAVQRCQSIKGGYSELRNAVLVALNLISSSLLIHTYRLYVLARATRSLSPFLFSLAYSADSLDSMSNSQLLNAVLFFYSLPTLFTYTRMHTVSNAPYWQYRDASCSTLLPT